MKKRIIMLILVIFLTTGCTCEYNLTIDNNTYKEEIVLTSSDSEELTNFNNEWQIPIDKEIYQNISGDPSTETNIEEDIVANIETAYLTNNKMALKLFENEDILNKLKDKVVKMYDKYTR